MSAGMVEAHVAWMRERNYAPSTIDARRRALRAVADTVDPLRADAQHLGRVLAARGIGPATRNVYVSHLSAFYRWAIDEGLCATNPAARAGRARAPEQLPRPMPEHHVQRALRAGTPKLHAWVALGAYAGLRCCEIAHLRPGDVSDTALRVERSKGGRSRVVPVHPVVAAHLAALEGRWWEHGPKVVSIYLNRYLRGLGIDDTAHALRHRFATRVYDATGDIHLVAQLLGHASVATTQVYARVSVERRSAAVAAIA